MPVIFDVFVAIAAIVLIVMVALANYRSADPLPQGEVTASGYRLRRYWFWAILIGAVLAFAVTIPSFPYPQVRAALGAKHITVVAQQYGFQVASPIPVNTDVVFDVTSRDVNHGFAIYGPNGRVFSQVQAMPGYVNHLPARFVQAGHYTIRCLEYCGIAHAAMQGGFDVK